MIVDDLDLMRPVYPPNKTDAILIVDPDRVLVLPISAERVQPVPRRAAQVGQSLRCVDRFEFPTRDLDELLGNPFGTPPVNTASVRAFLKDRIIYVSSNDTSVKASPLTESPASSRPARGCR